MISLARRIATASARQPSAYLTLPSALSSGLSITGRSDWHAGVSLTGAQPGRSPGGGAAQPHYLAPRPVYQGKSPASPRPPTAADEPESPGGGHPLPGRPGAGRLGALRHRPARRGLLGRGGPALGLRLAAAVCHRLEQRRGRGSLRRHPAQGLGWQPDLGGGASAVGLDVSVADVLAAGAFGPGLPESTPAGCADGVGLAPVNHRAFSLASPGQAQENTASGQGVARGPSTARPSLARFRNT